MFSRVKECHFDIGLVKQDCWILALQIGGAVL